MLFTATIRQIALRMCRAGKPSNEGIVCMVERLDALPESDVNLKWLRRYKLRPDLARNSLTRMLRRHFSLTSKESEPVVDLLMGRPPLV